MRLSKVSWLCFIAVFMLGQGVAAQTTPPMGDSSLAEQVPDAMPKDIVVRGNRIRNSVIGEIEPVAVLDADALRALGVTTTKDLLERLKGIASSAAGGEPAILLNGRRIASIEDLYC